MGVFNGDLGKTNNIVGVILVVLLVMVIAVCLFSLRFFFVGANTPSSTRERLRTVLAFLRISKPKENVMRSKEEGGAAGQRDSWGSDETRVGGEDVAKQTFTPLFVRSKGRKGLAGGLASTTSLASIGNPSMAPKQTPKQHAQIQSPARAHTKRARSHESPLMFPHPPPLPIHLQFQYHDQLEKKRLMQSQNENPSSKGPMVGLGITGLKTNSSFEAVTGIGMGPPSPVHVSREELR